VKARIVKIGNSQGIRIPKPLIKQTGLGEEAKIGTDTIIVTIRGVRGHDRACHGLLESLYPATRIM